MFLLLQGFYRRSDAVEQQKGAGYASQLLARAIFLPFLFSEREIRLNFGNRLAKFLLKICD
jgi:hypothetical protein